MSTFVSLHPWLSSSPPSVTLHQLISPTLLVFTPLYLLPCLLPHSLLHPTYIPFLSCLYSLTLCFLQLIVSSSPLPPASSLILSSVLQRYCTFLHNLGLSLVYFHCLFPPVSLLGDPLVTSSLLQLPWFQGKGTVITVWIKQTGSMLLYLTHKRRKKEQEGLKTFNGITVY